MNSNISPRPRQAIKALYYVGLLDGYRVGPFVWSIDGRDVIVTKDVAGTPLVNTIAMYTYQSHDDAIDNAYRMAYKQSRA